MANYWHLVAGACDVLLMINKSFDHTGGVKKMFYLLGNRWDSNVGPFGPQLNERFNHLIGHSVITTYYSHTSVCISCTSLTLDILPTRQFDHSNM